MSKQAAFLLPALCVWLAPIKAWASCSLSAGSAPLIGNVVYVTVPAFSPGSLNLGVGVGGTIATMTASTTRTTGTFSCTTSYVVHHNGTTGVAVNKIYPTSIPGIGMKISYPGGYVVFPHIEPLTRDPHVNYGNVSSSGGSTQQITIQLIKTGPIREAGTLAGEFGGLFAVETNGVTTQIASFRFSGETPIEPADSTCKVADATVKLGTHTMGGTVGSTTPAKQFDIKLSDCPERTRIAYRVDPATPLVLGYGNSVMQLDSTSDAKGVGIQLLDATGNLYALEQVRTVTDGSTTGKNHDITLQARYIQISPNVIPGPANASATVTVSYP